MRSCYDDSANIKQTSFEQTEKLKIELIHLDDITTNGKLEKLTTKNGAIWTLKYTSR